MVSTLQDFTDCAQLMRSSSRLCHLAQEVQEILAESDPVRRHLEMATASLFEAVTQQLDRERREHVYQQIVAWDPRLARSAESRHAEQRRLMDHMEAVRDAFDRRRGESGQQVDRYLQAVTEEFLHAWQEFEHAGEELVHEWEQWEAGSGE